MEPNEESLALRGSRLELGELAAGENPIANTFASPIANSVAFEMVPESPDPYGAMFQIADKKVGVRDSILSRA